MCLLACIVQTYKIVLNRILFLHIMETFKNLPIPTMYNIIQNNSIYRVKKIN